MAGAEGSGVEQRVESEESEVQGQEHGMREVGGEGGAEEESEENEGKGGENGVDEGKEETLWGRDVSTIAESDGIWRRRTEPTVIADPANSLPPPSSFFAACVPAGPIFVFFFFFFPAAAPRNACAGCRHSAQYALWRRARGTKL